MWDQSEETKDTYKWLLFSFDKNNIEVIEYTKKKRVTNICFVIVLKGWELLNEGEKYLHHVRWERYLLCGIRTLSSFNFIK